MILHAFSWQGNLTPTDYLHSFEIVADYKNDSNTLENRQILMNIIEMKHITYK